ILIENYEIDQETALKDVSDMIEEWKKQGLLDD
ncbi:MAG: PqqD family peptide modification chaperone, partial [Bacteroidales bacterium]|nr:PqqD family peptide modification chaperone [Bacteroidales bacterium]